MDRDDAAFSHSLDMLEKQSAGQFDHRVVPPSENRTRVNGDMPGAIVAPVWHVKSTVQSGLGRNEAHP